MNQPIVDRLKGHIAAGYQAMPRGPGPADDTLEKALAEIERMRRKLVEDRAQIDKLRKRIAELEREGAQEEGRPRC
jgi:hypothetical protein